MKKNSFMKKVACTVLVAAMFFASMPVANNAKVVEAATVHEVFGVSAYCTADNTIGVVWGQTAETMSAGYKYNVYVNGTRKLYEVPCAYYTINDVKSGNAEVRVTAVSGGIETVGSVVNVNVSGEDKKVEEVSNLYVFGGMNLLSVAWNVSAEQKAAGYSYNVYVNDTFKGNTTEGAMNFEGFVPGYYGVVVKSVLNGVESEGVFGYAQVKGEYGVTTTPVVKTEVKNLYVFGGMNCLYATWDAGEGHVENNVKYNVYLNSTLVKENTTEKSLSYESIGAAAYSVTVKAVYDGVETQGVYEWAKVKGDWFVTSTTQAPTTTTEAVTTTTQAQATTEAPTTTTQAQTTANGFEKLDANWSQANQRWDAYVAQGWGNDPEVSAKTDDSNIVIKVDKASGMDWAIQLKESGKQNTINGYDTTATLKITSNIDAGTIRFKEENSGAESFFRVTKGSNLFTLNYTSKTMSQFYIDLGKVTQGAELTIEPIMTRLTVAQPIITKRISDGKTVSVSSIENSDYNPYNMLDGNMNTRWASSWSDDQWAMIDLGEAHRLDAIELQFEAAYASQYQVMTSEDGENWCSYTYTGPEYCKEGQVIIRNTGIARYVKIKFEKRATQYGYSLYEFVVHGY